MNCWRSGGVCAKAATQTLSSKRSMVVVFIWISGDRIAEHIIAEHEDRNRERRAR
jgi:hypothetical protein